MAAISETIVREFLESRGFLVRQDRKHVAPTRRAETDIDLFVLNPLATETSGSLPFELEPSHLEHVQRAIIGVKGWHTETFSAGVMINSPEIFRLTGAGATREAIRFFGRDQPYLKILVVSVLPSGKTGRRQSIEHLRENGIDAVLEFRTVLTHLIERVEVNRNYIKSDILQVLRILKNYRLLKEPQLELFHARKRKSGRKLTKTP